jgi:hypothetical protein
VPIVEIAARNPFARSLDRLPELVSSTPPRKFAVTGRAEVAAYVDAKGDCLGVVPLNVPFSRVTSTLVSEIEGGRYDAARIGKSTVPSWMVVHIGLEGRVKESSVVPTSLEVPDARRPPSPVVAEPLAPPGRLAGLPAKPPETLSVFASPKRLKVKIPGREAEVPIRALVHVTADGGCDSFVPLELDQGLHSWFSAYLATWRLQPGEVGGAPVDCWVVFTARARLELSSLQSTSVEVARGETYDPRG